MPGLKKMEVVVANHTIDWVSIRLDFLNENLMAGRPDAFTLKDAAIKHGVVYGSLRNKAAEDGWHEDLKRLLTDLKLESDAGVMSVQLESEVEVRVRQANFARTCQNKAMAKLAAIDPLKLTTQEAIMLWRWGMQEERAALGLDDNFQAPPPGIAKSNQTREAVRIALEAVGKLRDRMKLIAPVNATPAG